MDRLEGLCPESDLQELEACDGVNTSGEINDKARSDAEETPTIDSCIEDKASYADKQGIAALTIGRKSYISYTPTGEKNPSRECIV